MTDTTICPFLQSLSDPAKALKADARETYYSLLHGLEGRPGEAPPLALAASRSFLHERLAAAALLPSDLPADIRDLAGWMDSCNERTGKAYQAYVAGRRAGQPRRYFSSRAHALYLLKAVAPTKLVDGAWLYGLLRHWRDPRLAPLIRTYIEELGVGRPEQNHVVIYRKLLEEHDLDGWQQLPDAFFTQGAIQLSLAHHAAEFGPEVIGFNLGYEQLPLHLLITSLELDELGVDPTYFRLHVTVDNASTGHARKALGGLQAMLPRLGDAAGFYRRVITGYKLNLLGIGTVDAIEGFDLEGELIDVLEHKAVIGAPLHGSACKVAGRSVGEWLGERGRIRGFLGELEKIGWVRRHQNPADSRFWQLIEGDRAPMFGAFSAYERQLVYDWIAGSLAQCETKRKRRPVPALRGADADVSDSGEAAGDFGIDARLLRRRLAECGTADAGMRLLASMMSPAGHHTPTGLLATRLYAERFDRLS